MKKFKLDDEARRKLALAQGRCIDGWNPSILHSKNSPVRENRTFDCMREKLDTIYIYLLYIDSFLFGGLLDHNLNRFFVEACACNVIRKTVAVHNWTCETRFRLSCSVQMTAPVCWADWRPGRWVKSTGHLVHLASWECW